MQYTDYVAGWAVVIQSLGSCLAVCAWGAGRCIQSLGSRRSCALGELGSGYPEPWILPRWAVLGGADRVVPGGGKRARQWLSRALDPAWPLGPLRG